MLRISLLLAAVLVARPLLAQTPDPLVLADSVRVEIEQAWLSADQPRLEAALRLADRAGVLFPRSALFPHYDGYAVYRLIQLPKAALTDAEKTARLTQGLDALAVANKISPMAESYILRWSLMAQTITDAGSAMAVVGAMQDELAQAERLGKENPRVALVQGVGTFFTPPMWGGGPEAALALLVKAKALFDTDHPAKAMPAWGRAETSAWLGVVHQKLGHNDEARKAYEEALRLEPKLLWVKETLLPGLDKGVMPFPEQ